MNARNRCVLVLAVVILGFILGAWPASAKGPIDARIVISGGGLTHEIRIPADAVDRLQDGGIVFVGSYELAPPPKPVPTLYYRLDFYSPDGSRLYFSMDYFPGAVGQPAMVRQVECTHSPRCWLGNIDPEFNGFLRAYLEGRSPALPARPGPALAGPLTALVVLIAVAWLVRSPPTRRRLGRLAY